MYTHKKKNDVVNIILFVFTVNPTNNGFSKVSNIDFVLEKNEQKFYSKDKGNCICQKSLFFFFFYYFILVLLYLDPDYENSETTNLLYPCYGTRRLSKMQPAYLEEQAEKIAHKIERKKLIHEDPVTELIKNMPQNLTLKRSIKARLSLSVSQKSKRRPIGYWKKLKYKLSMSISQVFCFYYFINGYFLIYKKKLISV